MAAETEKAEHALEAVILALHGHDSMDKTAETLTALLQQIRDGTLYTKKQALFKIGQMCHPKALPDSFIPGISSDHWTQLLDDMNDACAKAFNTLEKMP